MLVCGLRSLILDGNIELQLRGVGSGFVLSVGTNENRIRLRIDRWVLLGNKRNGRNQEHERQEACGFHDLPPRDYPMLTMSCFGVERLGARRRVGASYRKQIDLDTRGMQAGDRSGWNLPASGKHAHGAVPTGLLGFIQGTIRQGQHFLVSHRSRVLRIPWKRGPSNGTGAEDGLVGRGREWRVRDGG